MSQAPVGQRSAQRPQCRQTSSSLTITRPVFSVAGDVEVLGQVQRRRLQPACADPPPSPLSVKVMQSIGQMSTQASHSMHSGVGEHRLDVAVQAALGLLVAERPVEAELDLQLARCLSASALSRSGTR